MANKIRGRNEGSIYQRKNGRWRAQVTLDGRRVSHDAKTRSESHQWLKNTLRQVDEGMTFASTKLCFGDFSIQWLKSKRFNLKQNTWSQYNHLLKNFVLPNIGNINIRELKSSQIQSLIDGMLTKGIGIWTVLKTHNIMHSVLSHAVGTGLIQHNPASHTILPKEPNSEMKILDESQVSHLLITAYGDRLEALYYLAVGTGMRQSEILGLKWTDLDWVNQSLRVERQLIRPEGAEVQFAPPKTKFGKRTLSIGDKSIEVLHNHYERQHEERVAKGRRWIENGLIFTTGLGTPIHARNLIRYFKKLLKEAGLPEIRFHDLRHTAASIMLNHGIPVIVVSRRLGHARPSITLDVYAHLIPRMDEDAAQKMDELVTPVELHQTAPYLHQE
jgi:integrase